MVWFKVDDNFHSHPKTLMAGKAAVGVWVCLGSWSSQHGTNGVVPTTVALSFGGRHQLRALVDVGLLEVTDDGYLLHDFLDYNPAAERVAEVKQARAQAGSKGGSKRQANARANAERDVSKPQAESNPVPEPVPITSSTSTTHSLLRPTLQAAARAILKQNPPTGQVKNPVGLELSVMDRLAATHNDVSFMLESFAQDEVVAILVEREAPSAPATDRTAELRHARDFGAAVKRQHLEGEYADMPDVNRESFIHELDLKGEDKAWCEAAIAGYDAFVMLRRVQ
jgi:hypothetical protein